MSYSVKNRLFLLKRDAFDLLKRERKGMILGFVILFCGVALGVYIGVRIGAKEAPFGVFASLFHLEFAPFGYLGRDFLRFFLFFILASLCYFLPMPFIYPALALFFFGKHFGEVACVCFQSDTLLAAALSVILVYLPMLLFGGMLLLLLAHRAKLYRMRQGAYLCLQKGKSEALFILKLLFAYFSALFLIYVLLCGALYLLVIAL